MLGHGEIGNVETDDLIKVDNKNCLAFIKNEKFSRMELS